jgi:hypothetical protein
LAESSVKYTVKRANKDSQTQEPSVKRQYNVLPPELFGDGLYIDETTFRGQFLGIYFSPNKILGENMKAIIGVGIDCNKNSHIVCISDNLAKQHGNMFEIENKVEDIEYLIDKILGIDRTLGKSFHNNLRQGDKTLPWTAHVLVEAG